MSRRSFGAVLVRLPPVGRLRRSSSHRYRILRRRVKLAMELDGIPVGYGQSLAHDARYFRAMGRAFLW
jgi:hypothetical protein